MSNVLTEQQQHDIRALGRLGWSLRQIERRTGVRRETTSEYLKAAGIPVRARGGRPRAWPPPNPATTPGVSTDSPANPATTGTVSTDPAGTPPTRAPSASACEIYREVITDAWCSCVVACTEMCNTRGAAAALTNAGRHTAAAGLWWRRGLNGVQAAGPDPR